MLNKIFYKIRILNANETRIDFFRKLFVIKKIIIIINFLIILYRRYARIVYSEFNFINANFITHR